MSAGPIYRGASARKRNPVSVEYANSRRFKMEYSPGDFNVEVKDNMLDQIEEGTEIILLLET